MKVIAGLGNPGEQYRQTRHNIGFLAVEALAQRWSLLWEKGHFEGFIARGRFKDMECLLVKPQTFMNRSGLCVAPLLRFYKVVLSDLFVFYDDLDLPLGRIRIKWGGGDGGHHGVGSLIDVLGSEGFIRLRLGIGRPPQGVDPVQYVLEPWSNEERKELPQMIQRSGEILESLIEKGLEMTMNQYHKNDLPSGTP